MPQITLDMSDAAELAETLAFLLGQTDGEELFGAPGRPPAPEGDAP